MAAIGSPQDWAYLAEGGANIVFRYTGPNLAPFTGHVLRLRKASPGSAPSTSLADEQLFRQLVISPLLGERFLPHQRIVKLDREFLQGLAEEAEIHRPADRKAAGGLHFEATEGLLVEDVTGHLDDKKDTFAVEIKPKWGFLPSPTYLSPETVDLKTVYCRTCMHRQLKLSPGGTHAASTSKAAPSSADYCPLDLFSADSGRMERAVSALWSGWVEDVEGRGNSLRLFLNGKCLHTSDISSLSQVLRLDSAEDLSTAFARHLVPLLQHTTLLPHLARLQSSLDPLDIEGLLSLPSFRPPVNLPQPGSVSLDQFVRIADAVSHGQALSTDREHLAAFLLSATFKDCSVIARLPIASGGTAAAFAQGEVKVIDLDPKPVERLTKWAKLDRDIVKYFREWLAEVDEAGVHKCAEG